MLIKQGSPKKANTNFKNKNNDFKYYFNLSAALKNTFLLYIDFSGNVITIVYHQVGKRRSLPARCKRLREAASVFF